MEYIVVGGKCYDDIAVRVKRSFEILHSDNSGRTSTAGAKMALDPLGTFYNYIVTFKRMSGKERLYDELWEYLSVPRDYGIPVTLVYNQMTISFDAYVSSGEQDLKKINRRSGLVEWDSMEVKFIPMEANVLP